MNEFGEKLSVKNFNKQIIGRILRGNTYKECYAQDGGKKSDKEEFLECFRKYDNLSDFCDNTDEEEDEMTQIIQKLLSKEWLEQWQK